MDAGWSDAKNLLCVNLGGLGDLLLSTPAIRALRQSGPRGRRITLLATRPGARYAQHVCEVDEAIGCDDPGCAPDPATRQLLAMRGFDGAVVFTSPAQDPAPAAALCARADIPLVLAAGKDAEDMHHARRHLELVARVGARTDDECLSFQVRPQATSRARLKLEEAGVEPRQPFIAVHAGGDPLPERWPPEALALAARELSTVLDSQLVIVGSAADRALAESVRRNAGDRARSLAGSLTFEELSATLEMASLVVSNDFDTTHLAAAVGSPIVDLRGHPQHTPWMVAHRVISTPSIEEAVASTCDLWLDIHWRVAA